MRRCSASDDASFPLFCRRPYLPTSVCGDQAVWLLNLINRRRRISEREDRHVLGMRVIPTQYVSKFLDIILEPSAHLLCSPNLVSVAAVLLPHAL
jgi:hypothetical protein